MVCFILVHAIEVLEGTKNEIYLNFLSIIPLSINITGNECFSFQVSKMTHIRSMPSSKTLAQKCSKPTPSVSPSSNTPAPKFSNQNEGKSAKAPSPSLSNGTIYLELLPLCFLSRTNMFFVWISWMETQNMTLLI